MSAQLYPPLPTCPREPNESLPLHGRRVLMHLLATSCTATLSDESLEAASYAARWAVTSRDIAPAALANISAVSHVIAAVLAERKRERAEAEQLAAARARTYRDGIAATPSAAVPLQPKPKPQPPAADALRVPRPQAHAGRFAEKAEVDF